MKTRIALIIMSLFVASCANYFKRKECESTNWFQHGQDVAMRGESLENDRFLNDCRRVEAEIGESALDQGFKKGRANYCEPATVFETGKKGEKFSADMCDGSNIKALRARHEKGVREFCAPANGETAGATGKPYNNICPQDMEAKFMVGFKAGRKKFLAAEIEANDAKSKDIEREINELDREIRTKTTQLAYMGGGNGKTTVKRTRRVRDGLGTSTIEDETTVQADPELERKRDELKQDIDRLEWDIKSKRQEQSKLSEANRKMRAEMLKL